MRAILVVGVSAVTLSAMGALPAAGQNPAPACPTAWSKTATACAAGLVTIERPFVVRAVEGTLTDEGGHSWPGGVDVTIELTEVGKAGRRRAAKAEVPSGKFKIKDLQPGEYCFRIGVQPFGWSCVEGRIVVSETALPEARVDVTLALGK